MSGTAPIRIKVCIPIVGPGLEEALRQIRAAAPLADLLELRLDLISQGNLPELIEEIRRNDSSVQIVATHRRREESGFPAAAGKGVTDEERMALLREAVRLGVEYVDAELGTSDIPRNSLKDCIAEYGGQTRLIVSCHDFQETPLDDDLEDLWKACREAGAAVIKIATFARTMADNLRVLRLIPMSLGEGQEIVAFAMGERGKISRVLATLLGAHFTFASLEQASATAPGQLTVVELFEILDMLGYGGLEDRKRNGKKATGEPEGR